MKKRNAALAMACAMALAGIARGEVVGAFSDHKDIGDPPTNPVVAGSATFDAGTGVYTITAGGTDLWSSGEYCHFLYNQLPAGDFRIETNVKFIGDPWSDWAKAGIYVRNDVDTGAANVREVNAIMAATDPNRGSPLQSLQYRLTNTQDMGNQDSGGPQPNDGSLRLALQKQMVTVTSGTFAFVEGFVDRGSGWQKVGGLWLDNISATPYAGLAVTAHDDENNGKTVTAEFSNVQFVAPTVATDLPRHPGDGVATPFGPVMGKLNIREIWNNPNQSSVGNIAQTINSFKSGTGTIAQYQRQYLNIYDSDNGGHFGSNQNFEVVNQGAVAAGAVDNIAMVAKGMIRIPEGKGGDYTFDVFSDDGFELTIGGKLVMAADYGKGASDVFGTINLAPGDYPLQLLYWEGGGGASIELIQAKGAFTNYNQTRLWRLLGRPTVAAGADVRKFAPQVPNGWNAVTIYDGASSLAQAQQQVRGYWLQDGSYIPGANARIVNGTAQTLAFADPQNGGGWRFGFTQSPFPGDTTADDNNFATGAGALVHVSEAGNYTFYIQSDDGTSLMMNKFDVDGEGNPILTPTSGWVLANPASDANFTVLPDGNGVQYNGYIGNGFFAQVYLEEGDYGTEIIMQEGGGGSDLNVYAAWGQYTSFNDGFQLLGQNIDTVVPRSPEIPGIEFVPEPGTLALGAIGMLLLGARRRRH